MILNEQNCIRLLQGVEISLRSVARFWGRSPHGQILEKLALSLRKVVIEAIKDQRKQKQRKQLEAFELKKKEIEKKYRGTTKV